MTFALRGLLVVLVVLAGGSLLFSPPALRGADCNRNGIDDAEDLSRGASDDCNLNGIPDDCDLAPGALAFEAPLEFWLGSGSPIPWTTLLADMDGDGDLDIICLANGVSVFRNLGGRSFAPIVLRAGSAYPERPALADVDGDRDLDLVTMNRAAFLSGPWFIEVLLNTGDGHLAPGVQYAIDSNPRGLILEDLDADGAPDAAVTSIPNNTVSVLKNRGDGSFEAPALHSAGPQPRVIATPDLDADGDRDLAVLTGGDYDSPGKNTVTLFSNLGDGSFAPGAVLTVGEFPFRMEASDVDGDSDVDLVTSNIRSADLSVLLNDGAGGFAPAVNHSVGDEKGAESLTLADLNGDRLPDIVNSKFDIVLTSELENGETHHNYVSVLLSEGGGRYTPAAVIPYPAVRNGGPSKVHALDADGDGDLDLVTPLTTGTNRLPVLLNDGRGGFPSFSSRFEVATTLDGAPRPMSVAAGDLDGDGLPDLVAGIARGSRGSSVSVIFRQSGGELTSGCAEFLRGDVNSDGQVSLADFIAHRRWQYTDYGILDCPDSADIDDDEEHDDNNTLLARVLFGTPDWSTLLPPPLFAPGRDPTPAPVGHDGPPLGCRAYNAVPPVATMDMLRLGDVVGAPGEPVRIPVYLSASVPVDGVQLIVAYDPGVLGIVDGNANGWWCCTSVSFEGTVWESPGLHRPGYALLTTHPAHGVFSLWITGTRLSENDRLPPGEDMLLVWIHATVSGGVAPGTTIRLEPTNGHDGLGVGPYRLKNELASSGQARFVSLIPRTEGGVLKIVGDQSFYRADADGDEQVALTDAVHTLNWLFLGGPRTDCEDAADADDDGIVNITDAVFTLGFLFSGGRTLPPPHLERGRDPTPDTLHCYRIRKGAE